MKKIEEFRKIYISFSKPESLDKSWNQIGKNLGKQTTTTFSLPSYFITLLLAASIFSATIVGAAQATKPGDTLYPLKVFTDNTISTITNKPETKIEKRGEDIIKVSSDSSKLDEAIKHYQKSVEDVEEKAKKPQDQQKFKKTLKDQETKFKKEAKNNPILLEKLPEIIKEDENFEREVKGIKKEEPEKKEQENRDKPKNK